MQSPIKMTERFRIRRSRRISARRKVPIMNRRIDHSGLFIVIGQQLRFRFDTLCESTLQRFCDTGMEESA